MSKQKWKKIQKTVTLAIIKKLNKTQNRNNENNEGNYYFVHNKVKKGIFSFEKDAKWNKCCE